MSFLTIVQEAAGALGQPVPTVVFGSTAGDAVLWRNLMQREGRELARRHDWQAITQAGSQTSLAATLQTALPTDYDRFLAEPAIWNESLGLKYIGPIDSTRWKMLTVLGITGYIPGAWRLIRNSLYITPAPTAGQTISYDYVSKNFCESSTGTDQSAWAADSDNPLLREDLMALGITWRWLRAGGFDYAEDMSTYERELEKAAGRDRALKVLVVGGRSEINPATWPGTITP